MRFDDNEGLAVHEIPILIVDDSRDNLELMEALLMGEGFENVLLADSGPKALMLLDHNTEVGVVLLDLMMPGMDGYEVCKRIARNPRTQHIPVIIVTGGAFRQNDALLRSFDAGATDFIHKPLNEVELFGRLRVALDLYRERILRQGSVRKIIENETRFRTIINQAPVGIAHIDDHGRFMLFNDHLCALTGYDPAGVVGKTIQDLFMESDCVSSIEGLITGASEGFSSETRLRPAQGAPIWVNLSATPLRNPGATEHTYILIIENMTERKATADKMKRMVYFDALTQLPNRMLFNEELVRAIRKAQAGGHMTAVLFLDLDNFKMVNDSLGHVIGDRLLQAFAKRIQDTIRSDDIFARFGGDEFTLLLPQIKAVEDACIVAQKILNQMNAIIEVDDHEFYVGTSIGISFYPQDGQDVETLVKNADTAMYRAKELGRRNYQLFNPSLDTHAQLRLDLEQDLRRSLERGDFILHYQPQINLKTLKIDGMEALIRWQHPKRGLLGPMTFLPLAEETGLIIALGDWVIRAACAQAKRWHEQGYKDLVMYVNLSRRQFQQKDLLDRIQTILKETKLPASMLGIEITESVNTLDTGAIIASLEGFRHLGIKTALDDFGMGYSSLNNLKHFPLHALKIDKSFVQDAPQDQDDFAIVQTVIALGRSFGLEVVAEGVENEHLLDFVIQQGCDKAQGYHFSKPLPAEEFTKLLKTGLKSKAVS